MLKPEEEFDETLRIEINYPTPLDNFDLNELTDADTEFSASEKLALQNGWRLIKRLRQQHATTIFVDFFTEHNTLVDYFRDPDGKLNLEMLKNHPHTMIRFIGRLITEGLPSTEGFFMVLLTEMTSKHRQHNVSIEAVEMLTDAVYKHLLNSVRGQSSPTFAKALEKLCRKIIDAHKETPIIIEKSSKQ